MSRNTHRILIPLVVTIALVIWARLGYRRFLGIWPQYADCVSAMETVTVGQSWARAEAAIADAVENGGERWTPGPDILDNPVAVVPAVTADTVWVTCIRYNPDVTPRLDDSGLLPALRYVAQSNLNGAYNTTRFWLEHENGLVGHISAQDCNVWPLDTMDCRNRPVPGG